MNSALPWNHPRWELSDLQSALRSRRDRIQQIRINPRMGCNVTYETNVLKEECEQLIKELERRDAYIPRELK